MIQRGDFKFTIFSFFFVANFQILNLRRFFVAFIVFLSSWMSDFGLHWLIKTSTPASYIHYCGSQGKVTQWPCGRLITSLNNELRIGAISPYSLRTMQANWTKSKSSFSSLGHSLPFNTIEKILHSAMRSSSDNLSRVVVP